MLPRISKKVAALEAALDIMEKDGVSAVTYDSLAQATGMSKSGLIYHFPTRHDLLVDCHRYCASRWEEELEDIAGGPASELSLRQRQRTLVLSMGKNDPVAELLMSIHSQQHPDYSAPWDEVDSRWMPDPGAESDNASDLAHIAITVMSTGLWVHDHITSRKLSPHNREQLIAKIIEYIDSEGKTGLF